MATSIVRGVDKESKENLRLFKKRRPRETCNKGVARVRGSNEITRWCAKGLGKNEKEERNLC